MNHECKRCHNNVSIFWWPFSIGYSNDEMPEHNFELCDLCVLDFLKFMEMKE